MTVTVEDLSLENLIAIGQTPFNFQFRPGVILDGDGYFVNNTPPYSLAWVNLGVSIQLESGADVNFRGSNDNGGFMIFKQSEEGNYLIGVAYFSQGPGSYSEAATPEYKQTVVDAYNSYLEGEGEATVEDVGEPYRMSPEDIAEREQERAEQERETAEEYAQRLREERKPISEDEIIFTDESGFFEEGATVAIEYGYRIVKQTRGTVGNPQVSYVVEGYGLQDAEFIEPTVFGSFATEEEARAAYQAARARRQEDFDELVEENLQFQRENESRIESFTEYEFKFRESFYTLQEMMTLEGESIDFDEQPLWKRELGLGPYGDAASFSNGGNTLNLADFDTPRVTSEGITANPSGAVGFTIRANWRVTFELKSESRTFMRSDAVEGVERSGDTFEFTMYSGDRLELDIDNERDVLRPVLVMIQGQEWFSAEEIDDETSLTLIKAERLEIKWTKGTQRVYVNPPKQGQVVPGSREIEAEYEGKVWGSSVNLPNDAQGEVNNNPLYQEFKSSTRPILSQEVEAEGSFVAPEEITEDIGGAVDTVTGGFWSRFGTPIIIGGVIIIGLAVFAIWINSRTRRTVAQSGGE